MLIEVDARVDTATAARAVNVDPARIRQWAHRGLLTPVARTRGGRPLYRLGDVYETHARIIRSVLAR